MIKYNSVHAHDVRKSIEKEKEFFNIIKDKWNIKELKQTKPFDILDYVDDNNIYYELKSRNCKYNKYPTTMIGKNKINHIIENNLKCIFIFSFEDGNYYYEYNQLDELIIDKGGRNDRGFPEYKQYCYIPITKLIKI